jgi:hypothetical protein
VETSRSGLIPRAADVVVFGAPGASFADGKIRISGAGKERALLAARYWLSFDQGAQPMRVICVAGHSMYRGGIPPLPSGQSEAAEMIAVIRAMGVPADVIRPNGQFPLGGHYSISTVDEVAILLEEGLITPESYGPESPLAIVLHRLHGVRAIDVLRKVGFDTRQLYLLSPQTPDSVSEMLIRVVYRMLVIGGSQQVPAVVLRRREERLMAARQRLRGRSRD